MKAFFRGLADFFSLSWLFPIQTHFETDDFHAIQSDWEAVGNDIRNAIAEFEASNE